MKVVTIIVPLEVFEAYYQSMPTASYCPNTETMSLPLVELSDFVSHPLTTSLVDDGVVFEFAIVEDEMC